MKHFLVFRQQRITQHERTYLGIQQPQKFKRCSPNRTHARNEDVCIQDRSQHPSESQPFLPGQNAIHPPLFFGANGIQSGELKFFAFVAHSGDCSETWTKVASRRIASGFVARRIRGSWSRRRSSKVMYPQRSGRPREAKAGRLSSRRTFSPR